MLRHAIGDECTNPVSPRVRETLFVDFTDIRLGRSVLFRVFVETVLREWMELRLCWFYAGGLKEEPCQTHNISSRSLSIHQSGYSTTFFSRQMASDRCLISFNHQKEVFKWMQQSTNKLSMDSRNGWSTLVYDCFVLRLKTISVCTL